MDAQASGVKYGISDQKSEVFLDPEFQSLGVTRMRPIVPWNLMTVAGGQLTDARVAALDDNNPDNNFQTTGPQRVYLGWRCGSPEPGLRA